MKMFLILLALTVLLAPTSVSAQRVNSVMMSPGTSERIAAVVNDSVVSTFDLEARMKLAMLSSNLPDNPEIRQKLMPQILRSLIDEQLQLQEAKRLEITVQKEEIDQALQRISTENKIPGDIRDYISQHGGSPAALEQQIRAGLSWNKVVARELRPKVDVGDDEVDAVLSRIHANAGRQEYQVSEILLAVDNPKDEEQVKQFAKKIVQQIKEGANFGEVARQFSQGAGAASGGDIGWVQEGQLPTELNRALTSMQTGQVVGPIRSSSGYHILGLRDKRMIAAGDPQQIRLGLQQAFRPLTDDTDAAILKQEGERLHNSIAGCSNLQAALADKFPVWRWNNLGETELTKAPPSILEKIEGLAEGQSTGPIETDKGILVLFVCERHAPEANANRDAIVASIGTEKIELQARRLLRDLRRGAYIDIRLDN